MKKLLCVVAVCIAVCGCLFAQEGGESFFEKSKVERPIRVDLTLDLAQGNLGGKSTGGIELKGSYMFRIPNTKLFRWDVGLGLERQSPSSADRVEYDFDSNYNYSYGNRSTNIKLYASFWVSNFYACYGLGFGINDVGGAAFIPVDFRLGWMPKSTANTRCQFKMELASVGNTIGINKYKPNSDEVIEKVVLYSVAPRFNLGLAVRI